MQWDATAAPLCSACLSRSWAGRPGFVSPKHDPGFLSRPWSQFRTVLSHEFCANIPQNLRLALQCGDWYINNEPAHQGKPMYFAPNAYPWFAGSGVAPHASVPYTGLDGLLVADGLLQPHAFAEDPGTISAKLSQGKYAPLPVCGAKGCNNRAIPAGCVCVVHASPPLARAV